MFCQRVSVAHLVTHLCLFSLLLCSHFVDRNVMSERLVELIHAVTRSNAWSLMLHTVCTSHFTPRTSLSFFWPQRKYSRRRSPGSTTNSITVSPFKEQICCFYSLPSFALFCALCGITCSDESTLMVSRGSRPRCCSLPSDNKWKYPLASSRWPFVLKKPVLYFCLLACVLEQSGVLPQQLRRFPRNDHLVAQVTRLWISFFFFF